MSRSIRLTPKQNNQNNSIRQNPQPQPQAQQIVQSPNQLILPIATQKALEALKKKRAERSPYMSLELNQVYTLQFDPAKAHVEQKTFNGQTTERISHSVIDLNDREAGEKVLSLTYKQSEPIEQSMEQGYTVIEIQKLGTGFDLRYEINGIE